MKLRKILLKNSRLVSHKLSESHFGEKTNTNLLKNWTTKSNWCEVSLFVLADLKAQTAAIETGFVHGAVLLHKPAAQVPVLQGVQLAVVVVVDEPLGEVEQSTQLAQSAAVCLHLRGVVVRPEEGTVAIRGNVTALVNDVQKARLQDLKERKKNNSTFAGKVRSLYLKDKGSDILFFCHCEQIP